MKTVVVIDKEEKLGQWQEATHTCGVALLTFKSVSELRFSKAVIDLNTPIFLDFSIHAGDHMCADVEHLNSLGYFNLWCSHSKTPEQRENFMKVVLAGE